MAHGRYEGSEHIDRMRRTLTQIEFSLMPHEDAPADNGKAFELLGKLETDAAELAERLIP